MGYRKWVVLCSLAVLFFFNAGASIAAHGGSTGGGNVVSCTDPLTNIKTHRLLDYYEAETLMPELLPELGSGRTEMEKVDFVLDRLDKLDPKRAKKYRGVAHDFFKNTQFIQNKVLPDINDHGYVPKEPHCVIEQLAVQNISPFPQAKKYIIREEFWKKLSIEDRAGLILHEVIYEEAMAMGQKTSRNSRYFNALMSAKKLETLTATEYADRLERVGFTDSGNKPVDPSPWEFSASTFTVQVGQAFSVPLGDFIINGSGSVFRFNKVPVDWPSWLSLTTAGVLSGTPPSTSVGGNTIRVAVTGPGDVGTVALLTIMVQKSLENKLPLAIMGATYSVDLMEWSPVSSGIKAIQKFSGPSWLTVHANRDLTGAPQVSDIGPFQVQVDYLYQTQKDVYETLPDGTRKLKTITEDRAKRVTLEGTVEKHAPLGDVVSAGELDEVVKVNINGKGCAASIVGPRVLLTAAHCATPNETGEFVFGNVTYRFKFTPHPSFARGSLDMALGLISQDVVSAKPLSIEGDVRVGMQVNGLSLMADRQNKRRARAEVKQVVHYRFTAEHATKGQIIYPGDSGAPALVNEDNRITGIAYAVGISPRGEPDGLTHYIRLQTAESQDFLKTFAKSNNVDICGVTKTCP